MMSLTGWKGCKEGGKEGRMEGMQGGREGRDGRKGGCVVKRIGRKGSHYVS